MIEVYRVWSLVFSQTRSLLKPAPIVPHCSETAELGMTGSRCGRHFQGPCVASCNRPKVRTSITSGLCSLNTVIVRDLRRLPSCLHAHQTTSDTVSPRGPEVRLEVFKPCLSYMNPCSTPPPPDTSSSLTLSLSCQPQYPHVYHKPSQPRV